MVRLPSTAGYLRQRLRRARNEDRAAEMGAYMISKRFAGYDGPTQEAPRRFLGVPSPERKACVREALVRHPLESGPSWRATVQGLWRTKRYREEGYAAIDILLGPARHRRFYQPDLFDLLDEMVVSGAWWDYVDPLSSAYGALLRSFPDETKPRILLYAEDPNIWRRRSAILCQLKAKDGTDLELLCRCIEPSLDSGEFFLDKAIGWALRTYARRQPDRVRRYVQEHQHRLAPLARREALKHLGD